CTLVNNTVSNTTYYGIYLLSAGNCTLISNTVSDTDSDGVRLVNSNYCTMANNIVSNNSEAGIYLYDSDSCNFSSNNVSNISLSGIYLYDSSSCTLAGNTVSNTEDGIYLYYSSNCNLTSNNISNIYDDGIYMYNCSICNLSGNSVSESNYGLYISSSSNCTLTSNSVTNADYGLTLRDSFGTALRNNTASSGKFGLRLLDIENCTLKDNVMSGNWYNFELSYDEVYLNNTTGNLIDTSNLVNGKPIYYFEREANPSIGRVAGVIYCINCGNVEIKDFVMQNNSYAILLYNTSSNIQNNSINNTMYGVGVLSSHDVRVSGSRFENSAAAVVFQEAVNVTVTNNNIQNFVYGVTAINSENCTVKGNSIKNATAIYALYALYDTANPDLVKGEEKTLIQEKDIINSKLVQTRLSGFGVYFIDSQDLKLENNIVDQVSVAGIYLESCQKSRLVGNSVRNIGSIGIYTEASSSIELLDNTVQNVTGTYMLAGNSPLVSTSRILGYGIYSDYSQDIRLKGNTVKDCYPVWGIYLSEPVNATLESNTLKNCQGGLITVLSENLSVNDCSVTNCTSGGILVVNTEEDEGAGYTVSGCTVEGSYLGLAVVGHGTFTGNTLSGNSYGLVLYDVNNSLIYGNTMEQNSLAGLAFDIDRDELMSHIGLLRSMESPESGNNRIYNNYFDNVNNTLFYSDANNTWNTSRTAGKNIVSGPYFGGNYWADPRGTGFSENCTDADKDGIADSAYEIKNGTYDYLPLTIIPASTTTHRSSANYVPSGGSSGATGIDSAQKRVAAGSQTTFSFNNPVSSLLGLSFTSQQYSGNVIVRIELLGDGNSGENSGLQGEVYQQMNILVGNERFESGNNINGASINFRVPRSWVQENNIDVSTITINRFHNDEWNALPTEMTYEDEEYYYFTAETPGFSRYAITGDKLSTEIITPAEEEENETITGEEQTGDDEKNTPGFENALAVLGILASVFFARKRVLK
ncbi:MAG: NosD domain-containing protein, partial [Methanosarcina sp.]|nr:NosD domain-containing protein [Methanosarcina sp.]